MARRVAAKKNIPSKVRAWGKAFQGKDVVRAYRKQFHASWSCAIIELTIMGFSFSPEDVEEAHRRQIGAIQSHRARKAKKAAARQLRKLDLSNPEFQLPQGWQDLDPHVLDGMFNVDFEEKFEFVDWGEQSTEEDLDFRSEIKCHGVCDPFDSYDPFAE